jgi:hypothetical protein
VSTKTHNFSLIDDQCVIDFKKSGFMQGPNYKIDGEVCSGKDTMYAYCDLVPNIISIKLSGTWNGSVKGSWSKDTKDFPSGTQLTLWEMEAEDFSSKAYRLSDYALTFNCTYIRFSLSHCRRRFPRIEENYFTYRFSSSLGCSLSYQGRR